LLISSSVSPGLDEEIKKPDQSPRRKGVRQGFKLFFICLALAALTSRMRNGRGDFLPMMFFMAALMRILYAVIFQEGALRKKKQKLSLPSVPITLGQLVTATRGFALPSSRGVPIAAFNTQRVNPAQMVSPPSVTERTTKLLNKS
jgi:hypothetical protein